jgi:hypothetical protein
VQADAAIGVPDGGKQARQARLEEVAPALPPHDQAVLRAVVIAEEDRLDPKRQGALNLAEVVFDYGIQEARNDQARS